jgi:hypothetical protein
MRNIQMAFSTIPLALCAVATQADTIATHGLWSGFDAPAFALVALNAFGGLVRSSWLDLNSSALSFSSSPPFLWNFGTDSTRPRAHSWSQRSGWTGAHFVLVLVLKSSPLFFRIPLPPPSLPWSGFDAPALALVVINAVGGLVRTSCLYLS